MGDPDGNPNPDINRVSFNSGHGPALDGRTIPHMVAPGCYVDSPVAETTEGWVHEGRCGTSMADRSVAEVKRVLNSHEPEPMDEALVREVDRIVQAARRELG